MPDLTLRLKPVITMRHSVGALISNTRCELVAVQDLMLLVIKRFRYLQDQTSTSAAWVKEETALALRMLYRVFEMCHFAQHLGSLLQAGSEGTCGSAMPPQLAEELLQELDFDKFWMCLYLTELVPDHGKGDLHVALLHRYCQHQQPVNCHEQPITWSTTTLHRLQYLADRNFMRVCWYHICRVMTSQLTLVLVLWLASICQVGSRACQMRSML